MRKILATAALAVAGAGLLGAGFMSHSVTAPSSTNHGSIYGGIYGD